MLPQRPEADIDADTSRRVCERIRPLYSKAALACMWVFACVASPCEGAGLARYLTAKDRAGHVLLSQTGLELPRGSAPRWGASATPDVRPGYVAFPLLGGEHLPASVPTILAVPQPAASAVGPLNLDPLIQTQLNNTLNTSKMAVVATPSQNYAVAFLPRYARIVAHQLAGTSAPTAPTTGQAVKSSPATAPSSSSLTALENNLTIQGIRAKDLSHWIQTGTNRLDQWTSGGISSLERSLGLDHSQSPAPQSLSHPHRRGHGRVAAEVLVPPSSGEAGVVPLPVPAPEPSTWLIGGVMIAAIAFSRRVAPRFRPAA